MDITHGSVSDLGGHCTQDTLGSLTTHRFGKFQSLHTSQSGSPQVTTQLCCPVSFHLAHWPICQSSSRHQEALDLRLGFHSAGRGQLSSLHLASIRDNLGDLLGLSTRSSPRGMGMLGLKPTSACWTPPQLWASSPMAPAAGCPGDCLQSRH